MRNRALAVLLASALLAAASPARAIDSGAGTSGAQFMKIGQGSSRAMALGGAYVALAEGSDAMTWNPAGLAATQQREFAFSYLRYIQGVDSPVYLGYAQPMGRTSWGANFGYMSDTGFDVRDANGVPQQNSNVNVRDGYGAIGLARSFWYEKLFLGASVRNIHEDIAGSSHDTLSGDFGVMLKPTNVLSLGFAVQNFGASSADVARVTRGGAALRLNDFVTLSGELSKASDAGAQLAVGGEFQLPEEYLDIGQLTMRVGYRNVESYGQSFDGQLKSLKLDQTSGLSFGFGVYTSQAFGYGVALDYAFVPYGALGTVDQIAFKLKF
ncbi:MAG: hypothetical protein HY079_12925 [Elusimicrobia bacterium]|nr:hypothetical protein [Elusimicrobiota bacterium]